MGNLFLWEFGKQLQKVCKIAKSTKFGKVISGVYSDHWLVYNLEVPNIFKTEGACCNAVMHFST